MSSGGRWRRGRTSTPWCAAHCRSLFFLENGGRVHAFLHMDLDSCWEVLAATRAPDGCPCLTWRGGGAAQALSELQSALAAAEQGTEDVRREVDTERQRGGVAGAELSELRQRNAELLAHVAELEEDLQHSDADLEHAISQLEAHGIAMDDADDGGGAV